MGTQCHAFSKTKIVYFVCPSELFLFVNNVYTYVLFQYKIVFLYRSFCPIPITESKTRTVNYQLGIMPAKFLCCFSVEAGKSFI